MSKNTLGFAYILICVITGILNFIIVDYAYKLEPKLRPIDFFWWGFIGCAVLASISMLSQKRYLSEIKFQISKHYYLHIAMAILTTLGAYLSFVALSKTSAGLCAVFTKSDVLMTVILGAIFFAEKITLRSIVLISISILGFLLLSNLQGEIDLSTVALLILSSFFYAVQSVLAKKYAYGLNSLVLSYLRIVFVSILTSVFYFAFYDLRFFRVEILAVILLSQYLGVFIFRCFYYEAHKILGIGLIHIFLLLIPVGTLLSGVVLLNDPISQQKLIGAFLVVASLLILYINSTYNGLNALKNFLVHIKNTKKF